MKSQKQNLFKIAAWGILGLSMLAGCSSGSTNTEEDTQTQKIVAEQAAQQTASVEAWGKFVGIDPQVAKQLLANVNVDGRSVNLLDQVGKKSQLNADEYKAFMALTFKVDSIFANGVEVLNQQNGQASVALSSALHPAKIIIIGEKDSKASQSTKIGFDSGNDEDKSGDTTKLIPDGAKITGDNSGTIVLTPSTPSEDDDKDAQPRRDAAKAAYQLFSAQTTLLRNRVVDGAALLGFQLTPASMRDMLVDSSFLAIRDAFIEPVVKAIFNKSVDQATEEEKNFAAEPLASVTFSVDHDLLSFYEFSPASSDTPVKGDLVRRGFFSEKGRFFVLPAADNHIDVSEDGGFHRGPIGEIKK